MIGNQFVVGKGTDYEEYVVVDEIMSGSVGLKGREFTTPIATLEPILITKKLLLENGFRFEKRGEYEDYYKEFGDFLLAFKYNISNTPKRDWYLHVDGSVRSSVGGCDVQYIHEAQNLMNILGMKIEFELKKINIQLKWRLKYRKKL